MAKKLLRCRACKNADSLELVREIYPETKAHNMRAVLVCKECGDEETYLIMSHANQDRLRVESLTSTDKKEKL